MAGQTAGGDRWPDTGESGAGASRAGGRFARRVVWVCFWLYVALLASLNTVFEGFNGPWMDWFNPPFTGWSMYTGGDPVQEAIEVTVTTQDGRQRTIELGDYFSYRLWHRPHISVPERCEPLLRREPTDAHRRLLTYLLGGYNRRHPTSPAERATAYLRTWHLDHGLRRDGALTLITSQVAP